VLGHVRLLQGQSEAAVAAAESALATSKIVKIRFLAARVFAAAGKPERAKEIAATLAAEAQLEPQAYGQLIEGEIALAAGDAKAAAQQFTAGNARFDTWIGHFDLGRAQLEAGSFEEAASAFDLCIKRRGEALALFLDESPTYGYLPAVHYYQGRAREGLKNPAAAESFRAFLQIRGQSSEDPLVVEARKRSGQ
jgi:eukaryotic-like serine/threonine-protein kinase